MATKTDIRQFRSRDTLSRLTGAADSQLDAIVRALENEVTPPLALSATGSNRVVSIANITTANPSTELNKTIPPISNLLPSFASGSVTIDATGAGNATPSVGSALALGMSASEYLRIGINIDATGSLTLTKGTAGANLAAATVPATLPGLFAIGHFVVRTDGSNNVADILKSDLYQYVGGGGGGSGSGDASTILETLKNQFADAPYDLLTPLIVSQSQALIGTSTGAYSLVSQQFEFSAIGQTLATLNLLDTEEFRSSGKDVAEVDLSVMWSAGKIDTAATYEVTRNGGLSWQTISMDRVGSNTEAYYGNKVFTEEGSGDNSAIDSNATTTTTTALNAAANQSLSQLAVASVTKVAREITLGLVKTGSPSGNLIVSIVKNNAGVPSTSVDDILYVSAAIPLSSISTGTYTLNIGREVLIPGTYHIVLSTDAAYKASFSAGVTQLAWSSRATGGTGLSTYNGTAWSANATQSAVFSLNGYSLDVRARITSSAGSKALDGLGLFYDKTTGFVATATKNIHRAEFYAVANNTSTFTLPFIPEPDLLNVYYVQAGQTFKYPAFTVQGYNVIFPTNTFNNGGVEATVTLIFDQTKGGSFDNSDVNATNIATLTANLATLGTSVEGNLPNTGGVATVLSSNAYTDVTGLTLVIPGAGKWLMNLSAHLLAGTLGAGDLRVAIRNASNVVLFEREVQQSIVANTQINMGLSVPITTTGALTIKVSLFCDGGAGGTVTVGSGGGPTYFNVIKTGLN